MEDKQNKEVGSNSEPTKNDSIKVKDENFFLSTLKMVLISVLLAFSILTLINKAGFRTVNISGESMSPTFHDGTFLVIKQKEIKNDNIVVFTASSSWEKTEGKKYIKRVVATPGDKLIITKDEVKVNGKVVRELDPDYWESFGLPDDYSNFDITIPDGEFFVMGDNYQHSNDSLYEAFRQNPKYLVDDEQLYTTGTKVFAINYKFF